MVDVFVKSSNQLIHYDGLDAYIKKINGFPMLSAQEEFELATKLQQTGDKEAAYRETFRVLKPGGIFCGCFYVHGKCRRTDWIIRHVYQKAGYFTPPYETKENLRKRLQGMYTNVKIANVEGIVCFRCVK